MPEIDVYNYTETKWMRLDAKAVLKALEGNSSSELIYDWSSGKYRHVDCKDSKKAMNGTNSSDMVMEYGAGYLHIDSKNLRANVKKVKDK